MGGGGGGVAIPLRLSWTVDPSLSEMIDDALPLRMFVSTNPEDECRLSDSEERDGFALDTASSSCRILPATSTASAIPLT